MDTEKLIDVVTKAIMQRLEADGQAGSAVAGCRPDPAVAVGEVVTFGNVPASLLADGTATRVGHTPLDVEGSQYIVMTTDAFHAFHSGGCPAATVSVPAGSTSGPVTELRSKRVINEADLRGSGVRQGGTVQVSAKAIVTSLAADYAKSNSIKIIRG